MNPLEDILERAKGSARVGDHEAAERLLKNYLTKARDSREAHLLLGITLAKAGKLTDAADEFTFLLAKNPQDMEALNNIAVIYRRQGKLQDALAMLIEAVDVDPTKVDLHYNIGNIHKQLGNFKAASMAFAKVLELDPSYVPAYNNLGTIYDELHERDKAYNIFRKGLTLDINNPMLHFNYGRALEANGRFGDAIREYQAALRSKPGWLEPLNNLGIVYFKQGHHNKAISTFTRILGSDPCNAEAHNNMGVVLADQGRTKEAVQNYRQALEADPKYTKAVINLERVLEDSGDFADAVVELEKLVKLTPNSAEVRTRLAQLYMKMERYPEAIEEAESALEWEPNNIQAMRVKGAAQRITGNDKEAQAIFERILALDPGNYSFYLDLADIHFKRKEYKEAEDRILTYLSLRPNDRNAKMLLARLYTEMNNRTHALQIYEELAKIDPNDTDVLAATAELHKQAGSLDKALRTSDKIVNLQGQRATPDDLSELNKSLEFYESTINAAYSSSVKDAWERNLKLMKEALREEDAEGEDIDFFLGAGGKDNAPDEEIEALFIEDSEAGEELAVDNDMFIPDADAYPLFDELLQPDTSFEALPENDSIPMPVSPPYSPEPAPPPRAEPSPRQALDEEPPAEEPEPPPQEDALQAPQPEPLPEEPEPLPEDPQSPQPAPPPQYPPPPYPQPLPLPQYLPPQYPQPALPPQYPPSYPQPALPPRNPPPLPQSTSPLPPEIPDIFEEEGELPRGLAEGEKPEDLSIDDGWQSSDVIMTEEGEEFLFTESSEDEFAEEGTEEEALSMESPEDEFAEEGLEEEPLGTESSEDEFTEEVDIPEADGDMSDESLDDLFTNALQLEDDDLEEPLFDEETFEDLMQSPRGDELSDELSPEEKVFLEEPLYEEAQEKTVHTDIIPEEKSTVPPYMTKSHVISLLNYFKDLAEALPEREKASFRQSDILLKMEYITDILKGNTGIYNEIEKRLPRKEELTEKKPAGIVDTLRYLETLVSSLPDRELSTQITRMTGKVISDIKRETWGEEKYD
ncbi:MAG: tetratricopeptide repeat protein [Treponema sp.]|jgi:tetratricopeptide (TPR) repeat protein|nr:tetratricopeptide repeat protein [Treponema sp.]